MVAQSSTWAKTEYIPAEPEYMSLLDALRKYPKGTQIYNAMAYKSELSAHLDANGILWLANEDGCSVEIGQDVLYNDRWYVE